MRAVLGAYEILYGGAQLQEFGGALDLKRPRLRKIY
jgi:hypothetical protein